MKVKKILSLLLALTLVVSALAACGGNDSGGSGGGTGTTTSGGGTDAGTPSAEIASGEREFYTFDMYYNYDWASYPSYVWGEDNLTKYWGEMFNIHMNQSKPDANADETLNLRIAADDLPDVIWMDRGDMNQRMARLGLFIPIDDMKAKVMNNWYDGYVGQGTQNFYKIDGVNYCIPNWARSGEIGVKGKATGGNSGWMYTLNAYNAVGNPEITVFNDLYNYAAAVRDADLVNSGGAPIVPLLFHGGDSNGGIDFINQAIYPSFGGNADTEWYFNVMEDGNFGFSFRIPLWREAVLEGNKWFRDGLFPATNLTNTREEFLANVNNGRGGLIWYDQSHDDTDQFRKILRENDPGNSIELFTVTNSEGKKSIYPPAFGLDPQDIYHHIYGTLGWNGSFITTKAEKPERIFELLTWMLTLQGSVEMMYGPPGMIYSEVDSRGYPIIHTPESNFTAEEIDKNGGWRFNIHGASNYWDDAKFAADGALPLEDQSWVITNQRDFFTPNMILSDEFANMNMQIDPTTEIGIKRKTISDAFEERIRGIIMAPSREEAEAMMDDFMAFAEANDIAEIERIYNENYQYNKSQQGGFGIRPPKMPAGL